MNTTQQVYKPAGNNIYCKEPDAGCRITFKTHQQLVTQNYSNDDASNNLDDAVLDMSHRYQLLVNQAGIHPSQRFKTGSCTYPNDVAAPITTSSCTKETPAAGFYMQKQYSTTTRQII
ncbi:putative mitochondrial chaperone bcs1 [Dorcoceras hygrometricum]|uniref:Putative mitochondrial chaperone bcs1 n=1 Tax=Dorcoceras hygrometricum TaxID=472368 RepID=A0A2Z7AAF7_9LAMI|nr:putative mitochondrial chaperone bcs1 [Dorcoceras hygrometricum]